MHLVRRFFKMLDENPLRAWYGEGHVLRAAERGAISKLLVSDELFRCVFFVLSRTESCLWRRTRR